MQLSLSFARIETYSYINVNNPSESEAVYGYVGTRTHTRAGVCARETHGRGTGTQARRAQQWLRFAWQACVPCTV